MQVRHVRVLVELPRHRITGTLQLPGEGYRSRLTDYLNARDNDFMAITKATIEPLEPEGASQQLNFVAVSCRHIVFAYELGPADVGATDGPDASPPG